MERETRAGTSGNKIFLIPSLYPSGPLPHPLSLSFPLLIFSGTSGSCRSPKTTYDITLDSQRNCMREVREGGEREREPEGPYEIVKRIGKGKGERERYLLS